MQCDIKQQNDDPRSKDPIPLTFGKSVGGYIWKLLTPDDRVVMSLAQKLGIEEVLARVMANRGVYDVASALSFLNPKLRDIIPSPFGLKDMDLATKRVVRAMDKGERITIFADYDVDGATSGALLYRMFKMMNIEVNTYVPNRATEGYGPTPFAMDRITENNSSLLIIVDCGTTSFAAMEHAKNIGLDVVILDHHIGGDTIPDVVALVNPNRIDDDFPYKNVAAVGVAFLFAIALRKELRDNLWFEKNELEEPDLMTLLDLVALGTVCDVMPLNDLNRAFVKCGLHFIMKRSNIGLATLMDSLYNDAHITSHYLSYTVGPRINAGGRISDSNLGLDLLASDDRIKSQEIVNKLEGMNDERRALEYILMNEAVTQVEKNGIDDRQLIFAFGENWHTGVLGIIASRLKDRYHRTSLVMSVGPDGSVKGSGRAVRGVSLGNMLARAKGLGILLDGGGHAMAGGFSLTKDRIPEFMTFAHEEINKCVMANTELVEEARRMEFDAILRVGAMNYKLLRSIESAAPFGHGNPQPRVVLIGARIVKTIVNKSGNLSSFVVDSEYDDNSRNRTLRCVVFRSNSNNLKEFMLANQGMVVNIAGTLQASSKLAGRVDFVVNDIAVPH